jgi:ABC-type amino acid transport substrate-binding protein
VVDSARSPNIRSAADLRTATVGLQAATTDYDVAVEMQKRGEIGGIKVYPFDRIGDAMVDLAAGRITAVMKVAPVAAWLARQTPGLRIVAQVPNDPQPIGIGFRKDNPGLLTAVNRAIADLARDGTYGRLAQKWGVP